MSMPGRPAPALPIAAAPHRLPFLCGVFNLAMLASWWAARLAEIHVRPLGLPVHDMLHAGLHGPVTVYALFAPFILGFLSTVFPRWMGLPDMAARRFMPAAAAMALASLLLAAALWSDRMLLLQAALAAMLLSWAMGGAMLAANLLAHQRSASEPHWHGWSALAGWLLALAGIGALLAHITAGWDEGRPVAILLGTHCLTAAIFITVSHRMIPFFAGAAVPGYVRWRPYWLLGLFWLLLTADMAALMFTPALRGFTAAALAALTGLMLLRWMPRTRAPGLLVVLLWGLAWAPVAFGMAALAASGLVPELASTHALLLGMGGSLMVAMVTRVTQGHSGRPLVMPLAAWIAFGGIQLAAIARIAALLSFEASGLIIAAAMLFAVATLPWAVRGAIIYLTPRNDGRPG